MYVEKENDIRDFIISVFGNTETLDIKLHSDHLETILFITIGNQYEAPQVTFANLLKLSEYFGTTVIDVDDYANSGCETCDYGSDYGHDITIKNPTRGI